MSNISLIDFKSIRDFRGNLVAIEGNTSIPFNIARVYYLHGLKNSISRGFHAHRELSQVAICVGGKCRVVMDDGFKREDVWLDSPFQGLLIEKMVWHEMHDFTEDCIFLVLASDLYDEADYIRSYDIFKRMAQERS